MAINLYKKSRNKEEEEERQQQLAQIQENNLTRKNQERQAIQDQKINWINPNGNTWNKIGWVLSNAGNSAKKSVLDTIGAPMQSLAVGFNRGANQASRERTTYDKIGNAVTNYLATTPTMIGTAIRAKRLWDRSWDTAYQTAQNMEQAKGIGKVGAYLGGVTSAVLQETNPVMQSLYSGSQFYGQLAGEQGARKATEALISADEKIHEKNDKKAEELAKEGSIYGGITQKAGEVAQTIGYMTPSIAISAVTRGSSTGQAIGLVQMGLGSKGQTTRETLKNTGNLEMSERKGVASGTAEASSELMFNGLKAFKTFKANGFEDTAKKWISDAVEKRISSGLGQKALKTMGDWFVDVAGESIEELTTDIYNTWLDQSTTDPNKQYTLDDAINTVFSTMLSTTALNLGYSGWNKGAQKIHDWNETRKEGKNKVTPEIQSNSNENKTNIQEMINNLDLPEEIKQEAQSIINSDAIVTEEGYNELKESIKKIVETNTQQQYDELRNNVSAQYDQIDAQISELDNIKPENFQDAESRKYYAQQMGKEFDTSTFEQLLATYPENRNGKRTVKAYKEIAKAYGQQMALNGLSFDEVRANTVGAWQQYEPNKNITRYDNKEHKNQGFDRLNSQVWSQEVYDSYKETMTNQLNQQKQNIMNDYQTQFQEIEDNSKAIEMTIDNLGQQSKTIRSKDTSLGQAINQEPVTGSFNLPKNQVQVNEGYVSNNNGEKLNLMHGSPFAFEQFDSSLAGKTNQSDMKGIFFTDNPDIAEEFSYEQLPGNSDLRYKRGAKGQVYTANLKANNLLDLNALDNAQIENLSQYLDQEKMLDTPEQTIDMMKKMNDAHNIQGIKFYLDLDKISQDYDCIIADMGGKYKGSNEYIVFNNNQVEKINLDETPTNQKQANQPKTQQAETKEANLPISQETTSVPLNNQKQRKAYKSIIESEMMSDEAKAIAKKFIGQDTYTPDSNAKQLSRADDRIQRNGVEKELDTLETNAMEGKTIKADDIAVGDRLIQYYSKVGDSENLQRAIRATAMAGTQAGRSVQAFALLRHQTPEGMAIWIQNSVDKLNSKTKNGQFDFTQEMQEKILNSTEDNLQQNVDEVMKELGQQVPKDILSKLDVWRYFSMLSNPKTHIRNIVGNFAMGLTQRVSNKVAGTIEQVTGRDRTKTSIFERRSKANIEFAKNDLKNVSSQLGIGTSKYSNPQNAIQQNQRTFKSDFLEKTLGRMFNLNDNLLEAEDNFGLKNAYVRNLSDYMSANKLNPNTITNEQLQKARAIAIDKALEATFHQASNLASVLNQLENKNIGSRLLVGGLVPFKKTPINVAKAGAEYSPAGLAKSLIYDTVQLRKGNINTNQWIDNISKGLTGTGIAVLGYALAKAGILKAGGDDDKEDKYKQAMGEQPYAITINGKSYSLDWLAPSGIPLFVGAELARIVDDKTEKDGETENEVFKAMGRVADATSSLLNPMSEMSMISGITSTIQSFSQDSGQALMNLVVSPLKSYVGQTVPTALGQVARTMDTYERDTSSTEKGLLPKAIDQTKNQIMNKIPGLRQMLPTKKDIWGEEVETQDYFHNAVLPWTEKEIKSNPVDTELNSLYEKTGESIYPNTSLAKEVTYDGSKTRLTNQDYNEFKESYGKNSYRILNNLINSNEYKSLSDEQKVKAIKDVYTYANNLNKYNYAQKKGIAFETPSDVEKVNAIKANGGLETDYFKYKGLTDGLTKDSEKISAIQNSKLSNKSKRAVYNATVGKDDTFYQSTDIDVNEYLKYKTANIEGTKDENGKTISGTKKQAQLDYINNNISGYENRLLLMSKDYKLSRSQQQDLASYIDTLPNADELFELLSKNFTVKDGTVYYK